MFSYQAALSAARVQSRTYPHLTYRILRHKGGEQGINYLCQCETESGPRGWVDLPFDAAKWEAWEVIELWKGGAPIVCPNWANEPNKGESVLLGCGSFHVGEPDPEGLHDCCNCGIWFRPETPPEGHPSWQGSGGVLPPIEA